MANSAITVYVDKELKDVVTAHLTAEGRTMTGFIRMSLMGVLYAKAQKEGISLKDAAAHYLPKRTAEDQARIKSKLRQEISDRVRKGAE